MSIYLTIFVIMILTAFASAFVGNFLVLRRLSLMGDAVSHSVLPGIVVAFLLVGTLDSPAFFALAVLFALIMAWLVQFITDNVSVSRESVIGIVFTFLFSLGVIMLVQYANDVHLDQDAVLFGQVEFAAFNKWVFMGVDLGPRSLWVMGGVFLLNVVVTVLFYKELKLSSFDSAFANSVGFKAKLLHYVLMALLAITVVAAFEVVGPILVVALLVVPSATAYLQAKTLTAMIFWSLFFAFVSVFCGFVLAFAFDVSIAGSVAMMAGVILVLMVTFNLVWRRYAQKRLK